jgi:hypothetical protein
MTPILSGSWQMPTRGWRTVTGQVEHIIERDLASTPAVIDAFTEAARKLAL